MKRIAIIVTSLLLLTSCSSAPPAKTFALGKVVGCSQINVDKKFIGGIKMPCLDGSQSITLQALRGPMVLNVWGSWCYSCKTELPYFRDFYQSSLGKVQLVGVDVEEATIADARTFVVNQGMLWPSISDPDGRTRGHFGMGVPVTWFIAPDGSIKYKLIGPVHSAQELKDLTKKYLGIDIA